MSRQTEMPKINVMGLDIDLFDTDTAVSTLIRFGQRSPRSGYLVRPHVEFMEKALNDPGLMELLNQADFCLADGVALQWAAHHLQSNGTTFWHLLRSLSRIPRNSKHLRGAINERVAGTAFTLRLLDESQKLRASIFLVGLPQRKSIEDTANFLQQKFKQLNISGTFAATRHQNIVTISPADEKLLLKQLKTARPDIILVGLGFPRQEYLMARLSQQMNHGLFIGEGGTFDYKEFGGHIRRAPHSVQRAGLEWLWRLAHQPKRIRRQLAIPRFIRRVHKYKQANK